MAQIHPGALMTPANPPAEEAGQQQMQLQVFIDPASVTPLEGSSLRPAATLGGAPEDAQQDDDDENDWLPWVPQASYTCSVLRAVDRLMLWAGS